MSSSRPTTVPSSSGPRSSRSVRRSTADGCASWSSSTARSRTSHSRPRTACPCRSCETTASLACAAPATRASARATRELVAFLDDDDRWLPGKLSRQVELLAARPDAPMASTSIRVEFGDSHTDRYAGTDAVTHARLLESRMSMLHSSTFLLRRSALTEPGGLVDEDAPDGQNEDYELLLRYSAPRRSRTSTSRWSRCAGVRRRCSRRRGARSSPARSGSCSGTRTSRQRGRPRPAARPDRVRAGRARAAARRPLRTAAGRCPGAVARTAHLPGRARRARACRPARILAVLHRFGRGV